MRAANDLWVVTPIGRREKYLPGLLKSLHEFNGRIVFVNNAPGYSIFDGVHHIEDFGDINIYRWWNKGIDFAEKNGARYVAILNDDLEFDKNFLPSLLDFLIRNKLAIVDTDKSNNNGGAAWIMDLYYGLRLDERFKWWYGDTEIFDRAKDMNAFKKFVPENFKHLNPNGSISENPNLSALIREDKKIYQSIGAKR
jgi:GT2 family glycosyltransferase